MPVQVGLPTSPTAQVMAVSPVTGQVYQGGAALSGRSWRVPVASANRSHSSQDRRDTAQLWIGPALMTLLPLSPHNRLRQMPFSFLLGIEGLSHKAHSYKDL